MGKAMNSTRPQYLVRAAKGGRGVFLSLLFEFNDTAEIHVEADLKDDESALFPVQRGRVWGGSVCVRFRQVYLKHHLSLPVLKL